MYGFTGEIGQVVYGVFQATEHTYVVVRQEVVAINGSAQGAHAFAGNANAVLRIEEENDAVHAR